MANPIGRPTSYNEDVCGIALAYANGGFSDAGDMIPSVEGLSVKLEVCVKTLYNWRDAHDEFLQVLEILAARQHQELVNKGLVGTFNSTITKLILTKHGYSDKQDNTHAGPEGGPVEVIERRVVDS